MTKIALPVGGFTLIELLVVLSIMGVLLGISIPAYTTYNAQQKFSQTRDNVVQELRDAENRGSAEKGATQCASGFHYDGTYIKIDSSNGNSNKIVMGASCSSSSQTTQIGTPTTYAFLDSSISVSAISSGVTPQYIIFKPVSQNVVFYQSGNFYDATQQQSLAANQLTFQLTASGKSSTITITGQGAIYAQ